ncbi:hypothetical protein LTR17_011091 [Elasticomyces elasticus]|nr:hypothetical protein LTR17_011091 [Elasticomyces elasticus]
MAVVPDMSRPNELEGLRSGGGKKVKAEDVVEEKEMGDGWESEGWETEESSTTKERRRDRKRERAARRKYSNLWETPHMPPCRKRGREPLPIPMGQIPGYIESLRQSGPNGYVPPPKSKPKPKSKSKEKATQEQKPKHLYTRENPRKGEPPGSKPDHEMTKQQVRDKRDWIDMARRDLSLSPVQYSDEVSTSDDGDDGDPSDDDGDPDDEEDPDDDGEDSEDDGMPDFDELEALGAALWGNPMGLKDSTFEFMNGVGFNPMTGKFR